MSTTRSFVRATGTEKRFWDITWDGPCVEITTGKWGTNGRAREAVFTSPAERDAFIATEIAKIEKQGYREIAEVAPAADCSSPDFAQRAATLRKQIEQLARPAWQPIFAPGDHGHGRVRGPMTLDPDEPWPRCKHCESPLSGILELEMARLPAAHLRRDGVAQLFWCEAWEAGGGEVCTVDSGWLVRWHRHGERRVDGPRMAPVAIADWQCHDELPAGSSILDDREPELVAELLRSVGATDDDDDAYAAFAKAIGLAARNQHKLAGYPTFVQEYSRPFEHQLFQIEMQSPFDMNLGDIGAAHLLVTRGGNLELFWACH